MGSLKRRTDRPGTWRARYVGPDGIERNKDFKRKTDGQDWLDAQTAALVRGDWVDPARSKETIGYWMTRWLATKESLAPKTYEGYESLWRVHVEPRWGDAALADATYDELAVWFAAKAKALSGSRVRQLYTVLNGGLRMATKARAIARNPMDDVDELPAAHSKEKRYLTHAQVAALAVAVGEHYAAFVLFLAYTGARWGEATSLRVRRVDLLRRRVALEVSWTAVSGRLVENPKPKNHQRRDVPLGRKLTELLTTAAAGKGPDDLVFTTESGGPIRASNFRIRTFDPACVSAGLPAKFTPHELRHTAASLAIASGASVKAVQKMLGHKTATMTLDLYGHLYPDEMDALATALDAAAAKARESTADVKQLKETSDGTSTD